jgi:hypothetical protein
MNGYEVAMCKARDEVCLIWVGLKLAKDAEVARKRNTSHVATQVVPSLGYSGGGKAKACVGVNVFPLHGGMVSSFELAAVAHTTNWSINV